MYFAFVILNSFLKAQTYEITNINADNGLPQNSVKDIVKDKYGFIWLATEAGIAKFDGQNILTCDINVSNKRFKDFFGDIKYDKIYSINESDKNTVVINKRNLKISNINLSYTPFWNYKQHLLYGKNSLDKGVDPDINHFIKTGQDIYYIEPNHIEYVVNNKTVWKDKIKLTSKEMENLFGIGKQLFFVDKKKDKMFSLAEGVLSHVKCEKIFKEKNADFFWSSINDQAFLCLDNTIYVIYKTGNFIRTSKLISIPKSEIDLTNSTSIFYDRSYKKLYIGSSIKGLYILSLHEFNTIQDLRSEYLNTFYALLPFQGGILSPTGNVYYLNGKINKFSLKAKADKYSLVYDSQNNILYKSGNNLFINYLSSTSKKFQHIQFSRAISFLGYENNFSIVAFEGKTGILEIFSHHNFKKAYKTFIMDEEVRFAKFYEKDSLLIGNRTKLYKASLRTGNVKLIAKKVDFNIRNIFVSSDNNIWILTYGNGFYLLEYNKLVRMPLDEKKFLLECHNIMEDHYNNFWIASNNGLFKIRKTELLRFKSNPNYVPHYYFFDKSNGLVTNEFNGGSNTCGIKLSDSTFALPSLEGIVIFEPKKIKTHYPSPKYAVETFIIDNEQEKKFIDEIVLKRNFNRATILVDLPYFGNKYNLVIQAKFNTKNATWENIGSERKFTFTNLSYGNYELLFRVLVSPEGKYSYKKVLIKVKPYFYETLWFKFFCGLVVFFIMILIYIFRVSYLHRKNKELENAINERTFILNKTVKDLKYTKDRLENETLHQKKLIGTISHDITTPIKYLALTTEMLFETDDDNNKLKKEYLFSLHKYAVQLYKFTTTLKDYSEIYKDEKAIENKAYPVNNILKEKIALFENIANIKNSNIINNFPESITTNINKSVISIILHNIIDNAVKNTENGNIYINYINSKESDIIEIIDEGIGISAEKIEYYINLQNNIQNEKLLLQKYGIGLHLVIQLAQMLKIKIDFDLNKPKGTIVKIIFNTKNNDKNFNS